MKELFTFVVLGAVSGGAISLFAVGAVVAFRGSQVVNFALGAMASVAAYLFYSLHTVGGVPVVISVVLGVAGCGVLALLTQVFIFDRLRNSPAVSKIIASIGMLSIIELTLTHVEPPYPVLVQPFLPTASVHVWGAALPDSALITTGVAIAAAAGMGAVYRFTRFGLCTSAGLDNRRALSALGYSPSRVAALNWLISGCICGLGGILLAPVTEVAVPPYSLLIIPVLAAAVIGRFESLWLAVLGGLLLGAMQSVLENYVTVSGISDGAPFILIIAILAFRGIGAIPRTTAFQRWPRVGGGVMSPRITLTLLIALLTTTIIVTNGFWLDAMIVSAGGALVLLSYVIVTGYSGQLSLAQFAFAGLGAWIAGQLYSLHVPLLLAVVIGVVGVVPLGVIVGLICLRTSGLNLAIATLGFAVATDALVFNNSALTGIGGINLPSLSLFGWNIDPLTHTGRYAAAAIVALAIGALVTANLRKGVAGRRLLAVRTNARGAASVGIDPALSRTYAFAAGSAVAALGGIVLAFANSTIVFSNFSTLSAISGVAQAVVGGIGWISGAMVGGLGQVGGVMPQALEQWVGPTYASYVPLALSVLLIVILLTQPDGAVAVTAGQIKWVARKLGFKSAFEPPKTTIDPSPTHDPVRVGESAATLAVEGLTVVFGGTVAVKDVSLEVAPGEIVGLIGPNGAGKTTVIDAISGFVRYGGTVKIGDRQVDGVNASARANLGIMRSFQSLELFDDLRVIENLVGASESKGLASYLTSLVRPQPISISPRTAMIAREFELEDVLDKRPLDLDYGVRRLVAIARAVAGRPAVILLDEPGAGLDEHQRAELGELLKRLAKDWGVGVLLVEHDVATVMRVCDRIHVLRLGQVIATGSPAQVRRDPKVIEAFLGSVFADDAEQVPEAAQ